jgi:hypothetical protein
MFYADPAGGATIRHRCGAGPNGHGKARLAPVPFLWQLGLGDTYFPSFPSSWASSGNAW